MRGVQAYASISLTQDCSIKIKKKAKPTLIKESGTAISVSHITKKPILFLGTGQEYKDLEIFDKKKMIEKLDL